MSGPDFSKPGWVYQPPGGSRADGWYFSRPIGYEHYTPNVTSWGSLESKLPSLAVQNAIGSGYWPGATYWSTPSTGTYGYRVPTSWSWSPNAGDPWFNASTSIDHDSAPDPTDSGQMPFNPNPTGPHGGNPIVRDPTDQGSSPWPISRPQYPVSLPRRDRTDTYAPWVPSFYRRRRRRRTIFSFRR